MASRTIRAAALLILLLTLATATPVAGDERPAIGAPAPLLALHDPSGRARALADVKGRRGLVILFWAGWSDRSIEELKRLDAAAADLAARGVTIAAVNVERVA